MENDLLYQIYDKDDQPAGMIASDADLITMAELASQYDNLESDDKSSSADGFEVFCQQHDTVHRFERVFYDEIKLHF